ncbi:hypothetical protein V3F56_13910 [Moorellaceae bacterium AZ2]
MDEGTDHVEKAKDDQQGRQAGPPGAAASWSITFPSDLQVDSGRDLEPAAPGR